LSDVPSPLCQVGEVPTGDASDHPPLKLAEASQLVLCTPKGGHPIASVGDEPAIYVLHLATPSKS